jgi:hypothetical protein
MAKVGRPAKRKVSDILGQDRESLVAVAPSPKLETETLPIAPEASQAPSEANYPSRTEKLNRISIPLKADGVFDWDSMQERTKERARDSFKKSMTDSAFLKECGAAPVAVTTPAQIVTPQSVGVLMDVIARVEAGVYAKKTALPYDDVYEVCKWDAQEHKILDTQASAIANKYIPPSWLQYADLGVFATTMFALMKHKAALVEELERKRFNNIVKDESKQSTADVPTSKSSPAPVSVISEVSPSAVSSDIPPSEAARSLENFDAPSGDNHSNRSLG